MEKKNLMREKKDNSETDRKEIIDYFNESNNYFSIMSLAK